MTRGEGKREGMNGRRGNCSPYLSERGCALASWDSSRANLFRSERVIGRKDPRDRDVASDLTPRTRGRLEAQ